MFSKDIPSMITFRKIEVISEVYLIVSLVCANSFYCQNGEDENSSVVVKSSSFCMFIWGFISSFQILDTSPLAAFLYSASSLCSHDLATLLKCQHSVSADLFVVCHTVIHVALHQLCPADQKMCTCFFMWYIVLYVQYTQYIYFLNGHF